jgi:hypothetical protein
MGSDKTDQADHKFSAKGSRTRWRERGVRGELGEDVQSVSRFRRRYVVSEYRPFLPSHTSTPFVRVERPSKSDRENAGECKESAFMRLASQVTEPVTEPSPCLSSRVVLASPFFYSRPLQPDMTTLVSQERRERREKRDREAHLSPPPLSPSPDD